MSVFFWMVFSNGGSRVVAARFCRVSEAGVVDSPETSPSLSKERTDLT